MKWLELISELCDLIIMWGKVIGSLIMLIIAAYFIIGFWF